ncbi:MAG: 3-phosphoserine/phosphohydroxythreonine transaminase [Gammaproteobacteria bacterium]|nr:3-phosphoserine/phosphohydroxythreonine transaminase [Pseudomonadales bacterium]MCP5345619.1 3-phosphoserine/phosphohydroxythreonine transaminase [Pseudomonadales bacterium]
MTRIYNFGAGPAMLPIPVMEKAQAEFLDYHNLGAGLIEISHRSKQFDEILDSCDALLTELANIPSNYKILYVHGGAQMQFSAVPLNLMARNDAKKATYIETGNWAVKARKEAARYGTALSGATSEATNFDRIPEFDPATLDADNSYAYITSNNTLFGTRWHSFPDTGEIPLVADMTSEFLSRKLDISKFGIIFAGLQKNLGPAGLAVVIVREDLLGLALPYTPSLLNYKVYADDHSLTNTTNTFAIYMMSLVLEWLKGEGGVGAMEARNEAKAKLIYDAIDNSDFYRGTAHPDHRSIMNVTFNLTDESLLDSFLAEALKNGLYALKGHRVVGGARASIYNAMPLAGCQALVDFMAEFERSKA